MSTVAAVAPVPGFDRWTVQRRDILQMIGRRAAMLDRYGELWAALDQRDVSVEISQNCWDRGLIKIDVAADGPPLEWRWRMTASSIDIFEDGREIASVAPDGGGVEWLSEQIASARFG